MGGLGLLQSFAGVVGAAEAVGAQVGAARSSPSAGGSLDGVG